MLHESLLTYDKQFGTDHELNLTGLFSTQTNFNDGNSISFTGFPNDATLNEALQLALLRLFQVPVLVKALILIWEESHYGFRNKYLLDITARADGATKFGENNKWGTPRVRRRKPFSLSTA